MCQFLHCCHREIWGHTLSKVTALRTYYQVYFSLPTHRKTSQQQTHTSARKFSRTFSSMKSFHMMKSPWYNLHGWPRFSRRWVLAPRENAIWPTPTPPSLVHYDKEEYYQYWTKYLTTWPLPYLLITYQPLFSSLHLRPTIPNSCKTLCQWLCILLLWCRLGVTIQNPTTRTDLSGIHGKCILICRYCIYLAPTQWWKFLIPFLPIGIHWIYCSSLFSPYRKECSQHDLLLFRITNLINSSCWPTRSWSSTLKTILSNYCWLHQLVWNLNLPLHCTCTNISCPIKQCFISS